MASGACALSVRWLGRKPAVYSPSRKLAARAFTDVAHLLRPGHLQQLANILADPEVIPFLLPLLGVHKFSSEKMY